MSKIKMILIDCEFRYWGKVKAFQLFPFIIPTGLSEQIPLLLYFLNYKIQNQNF